MKIPHFSGDKNRQGFLEGERYFSVAFPCNNNRKNYQFVQRSGPSAEVNRLPVFC